LFFKEREKIILFLFALQLIFFFFGGIHTFLKTATNNGFISRYSFLLPFLIVLLIAGFFWLKRTKSHFFKVYQLLNTILFFLIVAELLIFSSNQLWSNRNSPDIKNSKLEINIPDSLKRNCYLLIYDAYANSAYLKKRFGFINPLDSILTNKGFHVYANSKSNYNFTHFSIASLLNMGYINNIRHDLITKKEYALALQLITKNKIVKSFEANGYEFLNLSIFDIEHYPASIHSNYLPKGVSLFNRFTFFHHVFEDIGWHLFDSKNSKLQQFVYYRLNQLKKSNQTIDEEIEQSLLYPTKTPKLIYAHYNMPHPPYFFDSTGKERPMPVVYKELRGEISKDTNYVSHLVYTNKKLLATVNKIMTAEKGNAVIIIAGDHGNRELNTRDEMFENFTAIYTPVAYREKLTKDSITLINIFPMVLNTAYGEHIKFAGDSLFFLRDAPTPK
jgi:hypothetical protein